MRKLPLVTVLLILSSIGIGAQEHGTGAIFDSAIYGQVPYKAPQVRGLYITPSKGSVKQFAPYAGDQGQNATCTGWATAYAAISIIYAKLNGLTDRNEITRDAFSPGFAFRASFGGGFFGCRRGQVIANVLSAIQKNGVPFFSDFDALCPSTISLDAFSKARPYSILGYTRVEAPDDNSSVIMQKIKKTISESKPVVVGMDVDNAPGKGPFNRLTRDFIWIPDRSVPPTPGHAMTVVSYDDQYGGGAFELENSWGRSWGNDGFFWVRYNDFVEYFGEAYELLENPEMVNPEGSQVSGALRLEKSNGHVPAVGWNGSNYVVQEDFPSGTRFRIYLDNNEPAFVYVIGVDSEWKTYHLFPSDAFMSPALTYRRNRVALPAEDLYIQTDQNPGEEKIVVLYSLREINLDDVEDKLQTGTGSLAERLQAALGDRFVPFQRVSYETDKMVFKAKDRTKGVVALLVSINHTP
jgi:Domain of unknown function (DUF4384)/Papain family cysteine protease